MIYHLRIHFKRVTFLGKLMNSTSFDIDILLLFWVKCSVKLEKCPVDFVLELKPNNKLKTRWYCHYWLHLITQLKVKIVTNADMVDNCATQRNFKL